MLSTSLHAQNSLATEHEVSSAASLITNGVRCARQKHYAEAVAFLALARERVPSDQLRLLSILDAFIQGQTNYWQAQQMLEHASACFAEADARQQAHLTALEDLLSMLIEGEEKVSQAPLTYLLKDLQGFQASQLQQAAEKDSKAFEVPQSLQSPSNGHQPLPPSQAEYEKGNTLTPLYVTCFGYFKVRRSDQTIVFCHNRNARVILRYLLTQPTHTATTDMLMAVAWPEDPPDAARHKLQIAISALRRSLNGDRACHPNCSYILYKPHFYQFNPAVPIRSDVDDFMALYQIGRQVGGDEAIAQYEQACQLYVGPYLVQDLYADWSSIQREQLRQIYLAMCTTLAEHYLAVSRYEDAAHWATMILKENRCDEGAHQLLIRTYAAEGRRNEAVRQYHRCEEVLLEELGMQPMPETVKLFQTLQEGEILSN